MGRDQIFTRYVDLTMVYPTIKRRSCQGTRVVDESVVVVNPSFTICSIFVEYIYRSRQLASSVDLGPSGIVVRLGCHIVQVHPRCKPFLHVGIVVENRLRNTVEVNVELIIHLLQKCGWLKIYRCLLHRH